jgi:hypothetical protein
MKQISVLAFCILFSLASSAIAQTGNLISVQDPRPVAAALSILEQKYGYAISYEDPELTNVYDTKDATAEIAAQHGGRTNGSKIIVPKGGLFQFHYAIENGKPREDARSLLERMVSEYLSLGGHTAFTVTKQDTKTGTQLHVIPKMVHAVDQQPLLDRVISIPSKERSGLEMLGEICQQLTLVSGRRVGVGNVPINALMAYHADLGAENESARDVLSGLLSRIDSGMVWRVFFDPGLKWYMLNLHVVAPPSTAFVPPVSRRSHSDPTHRISRAESYQHMSPAMLRHYPWSKPRIVQVQSALAREGFYHQNPSGVWDGATAVALRKFQTTHQLSATGFVDKQTLSALGVTFTTGP